MTTNVLQFPVKVMCPVPAFHAHATAFGLESRFTHTDKGYSYKELSEEEARTAVLHGHGLILRLLKQQNSYFNLGLDANWDEIFSQRNSKRGGKNQKGRTKKQQAKKNSGPENFLWLYPSFLLGRPKITSPTLCR